MRAYPTSNERFEGALRDFLDAEATRALADSPPLEATLDWLDGLTGGATGADRAAGRGALVSRPLLVLAVTLLVLALTAGAVAVGTGLLRPPWGPTSLQANTVSVTVTDLEGWSGGKLALILYRGEPFDTPWQEHPELEGVGSFVADVNADPFTITATLLAAPPFPDEQPSEAEAAVLPAGTYTLAVYVSRDLGPYNEWLPSGEFGGRCHVVVDVVDGQSVTIAIGEGGLACQ